MLLLLMALLIHCSTLRSLGLELRPRFLAPPTRLFTSSSTGSTEGSTERALSLSSPPSSSSQPSAPRRLQQTGAFKKHLPDVFAPKTHYKRALRSLSEVKPDMTVKNLRNQNRKLTAQSLDAIMKGLTKPITASLDAYKSVYRNLHPFEATVAELTMTARTKKGSASLTGVLQDLRALRASTSRTAKDFAARASNASSSVEAKQLLEDGLQELKEIYENSTVAVSLQHLVDIQKDLRRIPVVELDTPTVVLVGAPNVGKSSLVRAVSSGTPEVNDYPFTTRGVTIGHIVDEDRALRFQVMDTPGLLDRPAEDRNEMEKLTFASLLHLPTGLSGEKSTLTAQLNVRAHLKLRFPRRPWLDVVSKGDMDIEPDVLSRLPAGHLRVSVKSGLNVETLKQQVEDMLLALQDLLQQSKDREAGNSDGAQPH